MADREVTTRYILQGDAGGMVAAVEQSKNSLDGLVGATKQSAQSFMGITSSAAIAATAIAMAAAAIKKLVDYAQDATMLAARVETLGIVMRVVGNNAGYSGQQMEAYAQQVANMGITTETSRQAVVKMASSHIDLSHAAELARIAQDAAVIGNLNSSDAFDKMVHGIQSAQIDVLRTIGINVNFEESYKRLAAQLGKTSQDLTENEKIQARTNVVLEKGKDLAGTYAASMETAGKIINSMKRPAEETALSLGGIFTPSLNLLAKQFYGSINDISKTLKDSKPTLDEWGNNILRVTITTEAEFMRLAMLVDKVGGTLTSLAAKSFSVMGVVTRAMTIGQFGEGLENRAKGMKEANDLYASRYAATEAELVKLAEKYNQIGIAPQKAAENIRKQADSPQPDKKPKKDDRAWESANEKYLDYLKAFNARQVAEAKSGMVAMLYENEQGYKTGLVSLQEYLEKKQSAVTDELNAERIAALKNLDERQQDLAAKSTVVAKKSNDADAAKDYHEALKKVEEADAALINIEGKLHVQRMRDSVEYRDAINNEGLANAASLSRWAAAREKIADDERKAEFDHRNSLVQMAADASEKRLSFLGQEDAALVLHHDTERAQILAQTQWKLDNLIMEESEKRRLNEETAAQLLALDQNAAEQRAQLWWENSQRYLGFAQSMTTMAVQMMLFEEGQKSQIGNRMLATSIRFIAQGLQQFMFGKAKEHLLSAAAAAGQIQTRTAQAASEMAIGATMASAWAAFYWAMSLNPYGGQTFIPAATATTAAAAGFGVAAGAVAAEGAASIAAELGMAAAWAAGGIVAGALGEAAATSIEGGTKGSTNAAGYGAGTPASPVVTQPAEYGSAGTANQAGQWAGMPSSQVVTQANPTVIDNSVNYTNQVVTQPVQQTSQPAQQFTIVINNPIGERQWFENNLPDILKDFKSRNINAGVAYA